MLTENDQDYFTNCANRMNPAQTAKYLNSTLKTLAQWRYMKREPSYIKVGGRIYYDKRVVDIWLKSRIRDLSGQG